MTAKLVASRGVPLLDGGQRTQVLDTLITRSGRRLRSPAGQARGVRSGSGAGAHPAPTALGCIVRQRLPSDRHRDRDWAAGRAHPLHRPGSLARSCGRAAIPGRAVRPLRRAALLGDQGRRRADRSRPGLRGRRPARVVERRALHAGGRRLCRARDRRPARLSAGSRVGVDDVPGARLWPATGRAVGGARLPHGQGRRTVDRAALDAAGTGQGADGDHGGQPRRLPPGHRPGRRGRAPGQEAALRQRPLAGRNSPCDRASG